MPWYLRSLADRDTHHGEYSETSRSVYARCGIEFVPLELADGTPVALPSDPPDPEQICLKCYRSEPTRSASRGEKA